MNKTLPKNFTVIPLQNEAVEQISMKNESVVDLVNELKDVLKQAKNELLSPRKQVIDQLLSKAATLS